MRLEVIHFDSFALDAAEFVADSIRRVVKKRRSCRVALSGGSSPKPVYQRLAKTKNLPWDACLITFGDERCVPPDHGQSNYNMARLALLEPASISSVNILRIRGEDQPAVAARDYEEALREKAREADEPIFTHDLLLLGIGADGHTASLFPGTTALEEADQWVAANQVPQLDSWRITLTFPVINAARHVCFLVADPTKERVVEQILDSRTNYPASRVTPSAGKVTWLLGF